MSTVRVGARYQVVIPADVRRLVRFEPGDEVVVEEVDGLVVLFPKPAAYADWARGLGEAVWAKDGKELVEAERDSWG